MSEVESLRAINANLRAELDRVSAELARAQLTEDVMWDLWMRSVRPGWRMWRVRRRTLAREAIGLPATPSRSPVRVRRDPDGNVYVGPIEPGRTISVEWTEQ